MLSWFWEGQEILNLHEKIPIIQYYCTVLYNTFMCLKVSISKSVSFSWSVGPSVRPSVSRSLSYGGLEGHAMCQQSSNNNYAMINILYVMIGIVTIQGKQATVLQFILQISIQSKNKEKLVKKQRWSSIHMQLYYGHLVSMLNSVGIKSPLVSIYMQLTSLVRFFALQS